MKYVHIFVSNGEVFTEPFIDFINENFDSQEHFFLYLNDNTCRYKAKRNNMHIMTKKYFSYFILLKSMYKAKQIYIHGLFHEKFMFFLSIQPWLIRKCYWVLWASDLYSFRDKEEEENIRLRDRLVEFAKKRIIKNCHSILAYYKGDYDLAVKWYQSKANYAWFNYPVNDLNNLSVQPDLLNKDKHKHTKTIIQVGHRAVQQMHHIEIFEKLKRYLDQNIEIFCPLSYGDNEYTQIVIQKGHEIFGENFHALTDYMPLSDYLKHLVKVDVAIFANERHMAGANMNSLLYFGKKLYLYENTTQWDFFVENGVKVYSIKSDFDSLLIPIPDEIAINNHETLKRINNKETMISAFQKIFAS